MNKQELIDQLKRPFPEDKVHWRIVHVNEEKKEASCTAYIDARDVMKRLDDLFPMAWQARYSHADKDYYICEIGLLVDGEWIWRGNGAGSTHVEAEKGGMSDAFKRAAVLWGIAQYLYKVPTQWVSVSKRGKNWVMNRRPDLPSWAVPDGYDRLILKKKNYSERDVYDLVKAIESEDAYKVFTLGSILPEGAITAMEDEYPQGKKTEYKRLRSDLHWKGREVMLEIATDLQGHIDGDDSNEVLAILEGEPPRMIQLISESMTPEHQDKLNIILQEQKAA